MLQYERKARRKGFKFIAGIDEAGRGSLAGPVVAASVVLGKKIFKERIDDSKRLSPCRRERAFFEILRNSLVAVGIVDNRQIDDTNILKATHKAMRTSLEALGARPDYALIDGNSGPRLSCRSECIVRGDSKSLSVAAASIVAKVVRDRIMEEFDKAFPQYGFRRHKGYGTKSHILRLKALGPCRIHRMSFAPLKESRAG